MANSKYKLLASQLREYIAENKLEEGDKLKTEHELMQEYHVSRQTVRRALDMLASEGVVTSIQGSGTFVKNKKKVNPDAPRQIAVVFNNLSDYIFPSIVRGIVSELRIRNYDLIIKDTNSRYDTERDILADLLEISPCGIIIEGNKTVLPNPNIPLLKELKGMDIPIVFLNSKYHELMDSVLVSTDDYAGGFEAVKYLFDRGHRAIGGIFKSIDMQSIERYKGVLGAFSEYDIPYSDTSFVWYQDNAQLDIMFKTDEIVNYFTQCTAVICFNDQVACRFLRYMQNNGVAVPSDISIIGFDDGIMSEYMTPPLTTLAHPKERLGQQAAQTLLQMIEGGSVNSSVLGWTLAERASVISR